MSFAKENVLPNIPQQKRLSNIKSDQENIESQRLRYEEAIKHYTGVDLQNAWLRYFEWTDKTFKSDVAQYRQRMGSLCERFSAVNQDIKVWLKLCESYSSLAEDIFIMLHSKPLAAEKPFIFFSAWLMVLGQNGKAQDCERVFQMGLPKMPQNVSEKFVQKYKEIQQRHNLQIPQVQAQIAAPVQRNPLAPRQEPVLAPQQLKQSNPLIASTGSDMSLSIQMPSFPNMAMNVQQQQPLQKQHQPTSQVAVPSMQSFSQPQMQVPQVPQPAPSKAPMLSRTVSTIVRVGSNRIRRFDDGRLEQIQYSDEMVYPQDNEEFCFEEIRAGIVGYRQRWQNGDKIPAKIWLKPKPKPQKQVAQPKQEPKQQISNVPKPVQPQPQPVQPVQQIQPVVPSMASFANSVEQPIKPQKLTFDDAHMSEVKSNLSDNLSGLVPGSVGKSQPKQQFQDKENMTPVMPMQAKAKTPLGTVFVAQDKENMPAPSAPVREEKKMSESFGEEATEYLTVHTREAYHDVMNMFNTFLPSAKSATKQVEEDDGYNSVNSTQGNETTTIVVPIQKPVQNFEIFEDPMMTDEQPSGVAVFNAGALQSWAKPKEQQVAIFEDKENAPVANNRKSLGSRVSFVQPMDLSSNANQSQDADEEDDEEAAAKRSRFRKRDSIGLYQDRKKSKLTFANAPDYVTFIPEEPFEDENNDDAKYNNNLSNSSSSVGTSFNVSPQTRKNTIMNMGSLASSSKSSGTASSSNMSINSTSTQPFQMVYNGAPVNTPSQLAGGHQQQHHQQQMVHSTQNNQSLDASVFFDIDDEDVDFNVFELTESNINAAVSSANPIAVATIPVPQQPSLKNHRSSGVHGMNMMMANGKAALDSSVNSSIGGLNNMSGIGGQLLNTSFTASTGPLNHIHQIAPPTQSNNTSSQTVSTATSQGLSHPGPNGTTMTVKQQARSKRLSTTNDFTFDLDISQGSNINTADLSSILHNNTIMTQNLNLLANYNAASEANNVSFVGIPTPQLSSGANNIVDLYHPATLSVAAEYNEAVMNASLCMDPKVADKRSEEIGSLETLFNAPNVDGITLQLDNVTVLRLSSRLYVENGEGYFVAQNVAESSVDPQKVFMLKIQSPPCPWEFYVARKIQERTFGDAKLQSLFAPYHLAYVYKNCSFVLLNYPEFGSLKTLRDLYSAKNTSPDEGIIVYYAIEAVRIIETLHSYGIVHCNFNANNLFIKNQACDRWDNLYRPDAAGWENKGLQLAHHLRSIDTQCFAPGVAYDVSALVASCEQNVYYQRNPNSAVGLDYFGLADIVHYILHGKPIEIQIDAKNRIKIRTPIKRFFDVALWDKFFDAVLNTDVNRMNLQDSVACLQQVRRSLEEYFTQGPQAAFRSKTVKLNLEKQFSNILFN